MSKKSDFFLYQNNRYNGDFTPEHLIFNSNLQEFTQKISFICSLETAGKLTPEESYKQIKSLWKDLKRTKKQLGIGVQTPPSDNDEAEE
ncbi:hypothetical protein [Chamaesiphon sp. OTE_8_metabat_110]|uniref:DUF7219 family protein n=1 Tax=Chamaesiphon sp. OTE_8_metabat_110 TaxID=2964696 RepID=UPI00286C41A3|nr:hypothetical protein [Chamaesiphon sp. OTE_8_metabat_110]